MFTHLACYEEILSPYSTIIYFRLDRVSHLLLITITMSRVDMSVSRLYRMLCPRIRILGFGLYNQEENLNPL